MCANSSNKPHIDTLAVQAGRLDDPHGAVVTPIYQASTFDYPAGDRPLVYTRYGNNPTQIAVQERIAALEGARAALILSSGMAALSTAILTICRAGDHIVAGPELYGGTHRLLDEELPGWGIEVSYAANHAPESWQAALEPNTKLLLWEAITNPLVRVADGVALAALARDRGVVSLVDATFATPINQRPIDFGVDLVMHSATKYLGGHADLIGGVLAGDDELIERATRTLASLGGSADPHAVFLLERGIKTLALRVARHNENAQAVSEYLASHARVERVFYPTLADHPDYDVAARVLKGAGGVVAFIPRATPAEAQRIVERFEWIRLAPSLGGVESLVSMPAMTSHRHLTSEQRAERGMPDQTVRLAIGVEAAEDLIDDLDRALAS